MERDKPQHGEIRMESEMLADAVRIRWTMFLDPRLVYLPPSRKDKLV